MAETPTTHIAECLVFDLAETGRTSAVINPYLMLERANEMRYEPLWCEFAEPGVVLSLGLELERDDPLSERRQCANKRINVKLHEREESERYR